jgi:nitrilase
MAKIAVIQTPPTLLDIEATLAGAVRQVDEAAGNGAKLVVFPETYLPGYPVWIWRLRPGVDGALSGELYSRLFANAVDLNRGDLAPLQAAARRNSVVVVCGLNEREGEFGRGTLYNAVVVIGTDGSILNRHRKLMPTNPERMVWGLGDGAGLRVVDTPVGRVGTLICWENFMPLARYALYAQGVEIYVAPTYDEGDGWIGTLQHIAREGRCWVVGCGSALRATDIPDHFPQLAELYPEPDAWVNDGDSVVIAPGGSIVTGPLRREYGTLDAEVDLARVAASKRTLDVAGHYARPDVLELRVNTNPTRPVTIG